MKSLTLNLVSAAVIAAATFTSAHAADSAQAIDTPSTSSIATAQPMSNSYGNQNNFWYVGYGTGYQYTKFRTNALVDHFDVSDFDTHMNAQSHAWLNNLFVGYGHYTNGGYYYGAEFNFNLANASSLSKQDKSVGSLYDQCMFENHCVAVKSQWSADIDFLFGHTIGSKNLLGYGKIGAATTNLKLGYELTEQGVSDEQYFSQNYQVYGIIAGIGTRYQFAPGWDFGLEGDYTYYPTQSLSETLPFNANAGHVHHTTFGFNPYMFSAKATISYRF